MSTAAVFAPAIEERGIPTGQEWPLKGSWPPQGKWTEVLSPGNWLTDRREKFDIYAKAGVREYWIVNSSARTIELFVLREDRYALIGKYGLGETVHSEVLPGFEVKVDEICPEQKLED